MKGRIVLGLLASFIMVSAFGLGCNRMKGTETTAAPAPAPVPPPVEGETPPPPPVPPAPEQAAPAAPTGQPGQ